MKVAVFGIAVGLSLLTLSATVEAQYPYPYYAMGSNNYRHASTVEEGAARGLADVIRSSGAANLMNSEAAKNYEDARKKYIQNRELATQTYFDMQRINRQARAEKRPQPATQQQLIRFAKEELPDRPNASQLDPLTGSLSWPAMLRDPRFADDRTQLENLFSERAKQGYLSPDQYLQVKTITDKMLNTLRGMAAGFPGNMTIDARKFLEGLTYEASFQS